MNPPPRLQNPRGLQPTAGQAGFGAEPGQLDRTARPMSTGYHGTIGMDAPGGRAWEFTLSKSSWTIRQLPGRG